MLFLQGVTNNESTSSVSKQPSSSSSSSVASNNSVKNHKVVEDEIDRKLASMDGRIIRKRNDQLCQHPSAGECVHCAPLEPFDSNYLEHLDPPVKFMSFHAYLRKLTGDRNKGKFVVLENVNCRIKAGCSGHAPWPNGICTKCQPPAVTLERQPYRHVDYVQFENGQLMDSFLDYWRQTGNQRIGLMMGRYEHFDGSTAPPLAIKAVVAAIYEPLQESTPSSAKLLAPLDSLLPPHPQAVARQLNLVPVGWILTDLVAKRGESSGLVEHFRGTVDTFFLSAEECITAACLQNAYPNACNFSSDGYFGSKFVTVIVTGDSNHQIHFEAYQVSNQAMALQRDNIIVPTANDPGLGCVREASKERYVPDVFYSLTDKYNNRITQFARPLPLDFLLIDLPVAFPVKPSFTFAQLPASLPASCRFPIENREVIGQLQDLPALSRLVSYFNTGSSYPSTSSPLFANALVNFHLLVWLANSSNPLNSSSDDGSLSIEMTQLLSAVAQSDPTQRLPAIAEWMSNSPGWHQLVQQASRDTGGGSIDNLSSFQPNSTNPLSSPNLQLGPDQHWACQHCTYHNEMTSSECEMCCLPKA